LKIIKSINNSIGEYAFGGILNKVYVCHSTQEGYKIFDEKDNVVYESEIELNRRNYGEPIMVSLSLIE